MQLYLYVWSKFYFLLFAIFTNKPDCDLPIKNSTFFHLLLAYAEPFQNNLPRNSKAEFCGENEDFNYETYANQGARENKSAKRVNAIERHKQLTAPAEQ